MNHLERQTGQFILADHGIKLHDCKDVWSIQIHELREEIERRFHSAGEELQPKHKWQGSIFIRHTHTALTSFIVLEFQAIALTQQRA